MDAGENPRAGDHTLKFESASGSFGFAVSSAAGALPVVKTPVTAKGVFAVVVSSMGEQVHVYSSDATGKLSLDGQAPVDLAADGVELSSVAAGGHELTLSHGGETYKLAIDVGASPAVNVFVESGQNVGTLVVVTGEDKARVFLNGKALVPLTRNGQLRIANLEPERVRGAGFEARLSGRSRTENRGSQGRAAPAGLCSQSHTARRFAKYPERPSGGNRSH